MCIRDSYCVYCYKNGAFTEAYTMEEMIRHCAEFHEEFRDENGKSYTQMCIRDSRWYCGFPVGE